MLRGKIESHLSVAPPAQGPAKNRESGANPERYRHCKRGDSAQDESRPLGKPEKVWGVLEA